MASLGQDLALIRKDQNLSLDQVNKATKIPLRILRSIEDDSIFADFDNNATYIRSYVRSYAKALTIDEKAVIYALDKRQKNGYSGSLRDAWDGDIDWDKVESKDSGEASESKPQDSDMVHDHSPEFQPGPGPSESKNRTRPVSTESTVDQSQVRSINWADIGRDFNPMRSTRPDIWMGVIGVVLILLIGTLSYFYFSGSDTASEPPQEQQAQATTQQSSSAAVSTDSLQLNVVSPMDEDSPTVVEDTSGVSLQNESQALESLPDTLNIVLYAAYGKLEPVRVSTDIMDNVNPYWVEQGDALRFNFVNEMEIRGQFSNIVLLLNGHVIQDFREQFYNPDTRLVEINRSFFENDPKWLQPAPDSLDIDAPPPSSINERPTFN
jgi:cytoskeletal protein RodZ